MDDKTAETVAVQGGPFEIGTLDIVVLIIMVVGGIFWYLKRKKNETPDYQFTPVPGGLGPMRERAYSDTGFVTKMKSGGRNVVVFYGSQTGTAEDVAMRLVKDANKYGLKGISIDPEEIDLDDLPNLAELNPCLAIFCVATYGEGDPTDNAQEFYEYMQRGESDFTGINYAVFALGNKTYEHFNAMGKYTDKRLEELGATRVYELGLGDDDGNLEEDFMVWREAFWPTVCEYFNIDPSSFQDVNVRQYALTVHDTFDESRVFSGEISRLNSYNNQRPPYDAKNPYLAPVAVNDELHKGGHRSCLHIEFSISEARLRYEAGDHLGVYATNDPETVELLGELLQTDLSTVVTLTNTDEESSKKHPFPCPTSYRTALTHYVDICTPPRTNVLKEIAEYCTDPEEANFLKSMCHASEESRKKYHDWIILDHRQIKHILQDLKSCKPPMDHLLELLPRLQPRYYSISSSPKWKPGIVSITALVLKYYTRTGHLVKGVATNYLAQKTPVEALPNSPQVPVFVRKSQLRLPHQTKTSIIMIGPGTGIAPFMGFLQERAKLKEAGKEIGEAVLYTGCRHKDKDFIYQGQLEDWHAQGILNGLHVAFSRDQEHKIYVQHLLAKNSEETWRLLEQGCHVYVCGDARNMAKDVQNAFVQIMQDHGGKSPKEASSYLQKMEAQKRYQADVWS